MVIIAIIINNNFLLTEHEGSTAQGTLAQGRGSMGRAERGLYKTT